MKYLKHILKTYETIKRFSIDLFNIIKYASDVLGYKVFDAHNKGDIYKSLSSTEDEDKRLCDINSSVVGFSIQFFVREMPL